MADVPPKTAARIVELLDLAQETFSSFTAADIPAVVLWVAQEVVGSRKFPKGLEERCITRISDELFAECIAEAEAPPNEPDADAPTEPGPAQLIADFARECRYQLRYGSRTGIGRDPRRCAIV